MRHVFFRVPSFWSGSAPTHELRSVPVVENSAEAMYLNVALIMDFQIFFAMF
jgi:hypothetical protein